VALTLITLCICWSLIIWHNKYRDNNSVWSHISKRRNHRHTRCLCRTLCRIVGMSHYWVFSLVKCVLRVLASSVISWCMCVLSVWFQNIIKMMYILLVLYTQLDYLIWSSWCFRYINWYIQALLPVSQIEPFFSYAQEDTHENQFRRNIHSLNLPSELCYCDSRCARAFEVQLKLEQYTVAWKWLFVTILNFHKTYLSKCAIKPFEHVTSRTFAMVS
jgi:hypothetical protein